MPWRTRWSVILTAARSLERLLGERVVKSEVGGRGKDLAVAHFHVITLLGEETGKKRA